MGYPAPGFPPGWAVNPTGGGPALGAGTTVTLTPEGPAEVGTAVATEEKINEFPCTADNAIKILYITTVNSPTCSSLIENATGTDAAAYYEENDQETNNSGNSRNYGTDTRKKNCINRSYPTHATMK